ncbi:MAG TPA: CusA/CzcA family heavy metal efflux RND transporter [Vicinamibacteria bacterium]|nr:CusA/CzcA family heavy metal efflux RND transporter [Vicinamibacteria bacterium]
MLERIIDWSIENRFFVILATVFLTLAGVHALRTTPLDAIPDLSDVQVIIFTEYPGQAPRVVEDQITYPITTQMLAVPFAKVVRGYSFFGLSFVYVIFEDGTDMYWARSRVLEYMNYVAGRLPRGVTPTIGPDATGVGWAYMYALRSTKRSLGDLRSIQDWFLKYELTAIPGVSEVASVGGFVKQYQITVDPVKLRAYDIPISKIRMAVQRSNSDVGGRVLEFAETEFMVLGEGYIKDVTHVENIALGVDLNGTPILLKDVGTVQRGPDMRRGLAELNGEGEAVGGIIVVRFGANAYEVIQRVKDKLAELKQGLPEDVEIVTVYDRSALIERSIATLAEKLIEESVVVALVCILFLLHLRSALVAIFTLPVAILIAFIVMNQQGLNSNIMSLGGIAIAIGAMVDAAIIMIENAHKHLERDVGKKEHWKIIADAAKEVGPTLFYALLVITVSFAPVFTLQAQEGRLFKPLAFTKTYSMAAASLLSITIVPVLMGYWIRGKIRSEEANPISRLLIHVYDPILHFVLRFRWSVLVVAVLLMASVLIPIAGLGSEFMPPLWEGDLLYMPTTLPGISITKARQVLQQTDKIIMQFPEVDRVFGKVGRADTATDPAPISMIETTITLKPESEWRPGMTPEKLIEEMNQAIQFPGLTNAWTMPIKTRIDMLSTGIKTPVGIKIAGADLLTLQEIGRNVEAVIRRVPGTLSVYSERALGGNYLKFDIKREEIARYGLTVGDVQDVIQSAIGGMNLTTTVEGLERYPVNLRYARELRHSLPMLREVLVPTPMGQHIPLGHLADMRFEKGPPAIKSENSRPNAWIYVDITGIDVGTYVERAQQAVAQNVELPGGYSIGWSGQYEYMVRARERVMVVVPLTLLIVFVIIYLNTRSFAKTFIVLLAVPFSLIGAFWLLYLLDYNLSIAVWVGMIALAGLDAETGVVMLLYLDAAYGEATRTGRMTNRRHLVDAIYQGAVKRVRPKVMTASVIVAGLLPILWSQGSGADVMKRIATPMVGGVVTSVVLELTVYPVIYYIWKGWRVPEVGKESELATVG